MHVRCASDTCEQQSRPGADRLALSPSLGAWSTASSSRPCVALPQLRNLIAASSTVESISLELPGRSKCMHLSCDLLALASLAAPCECPRGITNAITCRRYSQIS
jgi:hypothetical protein